MLFYHNPTGSLVWVAFFFCQRFIARAYYLFAPFFCFGTAAVVGLHSWIRTVDVQREWYVVHMAIQEGYYLTKSRRTVSSTRVQINNNIRPIEWATMGVLRDCNLGYDRKYAHTVARNSQVQVCIVLSTVSRKLQNRTTPSLSLLLFFFHPFFLELTFRISSLISTCSFQYSVNATTYLKTRCRKWTLCQQSAMWVETDCLHI